MGEADPLIMAPVGDADCLSVFIRSWMIDAYYLAQYRLIFLQDAQNTLRQTYEDFPNLCDLYTLIIHPDYEKLASALGFVENYSGIPKLDLLDVFRTRALFSFRYE
jgi:hypothetical protein